jgi:LysR family transcriptional regulator, transcriptional activator of nhaA
MNYKQLRYFWVIAKAGSISRASEILEITPQTLSGQISIFEADLGVTLFQRAGRGLALTEAGRLALPYAEDIFTTGNALEENLRSNPNRHNRTFKVGVVDVVPKSIAYQLLSPAMHLSVPIKIICKEDKLEPLLGQLAIHKLDMVLSDQPIPDNVDIKSVNHSLGECAMSLFGTAALNAQYSADFPTSLQGAPMLMMSTESGIQKPLLRWFNHHHIATNIVGEFDDSALMKAFGQAGIGVFCGTYGIK